MAKIKYAKYCLALAASLAAFAGAVSINPLPAPQNITWRTSGSKSVLGRLSLNAPSNIISGAFDRATSTISSLQWVPAGTKAPITTYAPFPTGGATKRDYTNGTVIIGVNVQVLDIHTRLTHGVDELYALDVTSSSSSVQITAKTVMEFSVPSLLCSRLSSATALAAS